MPQALRQGVELRRDEDVLDTWFSSALWPFSTLGWPDKTPELARYYPTSTLVTGFDIIFFWVARMMMMGLHFMKEVPFDTVYVHALVRDEKGQKMSKTKGNVMDPLDIVDGVDLDTLIVKRTSTLADKKDAARIASETKKAYPAVFRLTGRMRCALRWPRWPRRGATSSCRCRWSRATGISRPRSGMPRASAR